MVMLMLRVIWFVLDIVWGMVKLVIFIWRVFVILIVFFRLVLERIIVNFFFL